MIKVQFTDQITLNYGVKCLLFGDSGIGKTRLLATAPNPLILSCESGLLSLRKERVPYIDISTYKDLTEAYDWVIRSNEARHYYTFGLDSLSEVAETILAEELKRTADGRKAYGNMQQTMYPLIRTFRDIDGKNIVMVAKQMMVQNGTVKVACPIMPSEKLQAQIPYFFDLVLHMFVGNDPTNGKSYTGIHTQTSTNWQGKDRSGTLDSVEYPHLGNIFKKAIA